MTADRTDVSSLMADVRMAIVDKDHTCIDIVTAVSGTDYNMVITGVDASTIEYIKATNNIHVGGWQGAYDLTLPVSHKIYVETHQDGQEMITQYTILSGHLTASILFHRI